MESKEYLHLGGPLHGEMVFEIETIKEITEPDGSKSFYRGLQKHCDLGEGYDLKVFVHSSWIEEKEGEIDCPILGVYYAGFFTGWIRGNDFARTQIEVMK